MSSMTAAQEKPLQQSIEEAQRPWARPQPHEPLTQSLVEQSDAAEHPPPGPLRQLAEPANGLPQIPEQQETAS